MHTFPKSLLSGGYKFYRAKILFLDLKEAWFVKIDDHPQIKRECKIRSCLVLKTKICNAVVGMKGKTDKYLKNRRKAIG